MIGVAVAVAGSAGAVTRFLLDGWMRRRWPSTWPWATFWINTTGSLLLGLITGAVLFDGAPTALKLVAGVGFCGGYTTFGTASFETVRLLEQGRRIPALGYTAGSLLAGTGAAGLGVLLAWVA